LKGVQPRPWPDLIEGGSMRIGQVVVASFLVAVPAIAFAGAPPTVPEPETLALLAIGAVALLIARRKRRK
jgi:hypothetical protein